MSDKGDKSLLSRIRALGARAVKTFLKTFTAVVIVGGLMLVAAYWVSKLFYPIAQPFIEFGAILVLCFCVIKLVQFAEAA